MVEVQGSLACTSTCTPTCEHRRPTQPGQPSPTHLNRQVLQDPTTQYTAGPTHLNRRVLRQPIFLAFFPPNRWLVRSAMSRASSRCCRWSSPTGTRSDCRREGGWGGEAGRLGSGEEGFSQSGAKPVPGTYHRPQAARLPSPTAAARNAWPAQLHTAPHQPASWPASQPAS